MATIVKDLGIATAYGYAKSKGYTGTEEEFAELIASYATVAEEASQSAEDARTAQEAAETARSYAEEARDAAVTARTGAEAANADAHEDADNAGRSAGNADASASTASAKATEAGISAQTASTKATEASASATAAQTAQAAAEAARTGSETARTAAEAAQAVAEEEAQKVAATVTQVETNTADISNLKQDLDVVGSLERAKEADILPSAFLANSGIAFYTGEVRTGVTSVATDFINVHGIDKIRYSRRKTVATSGITTNTLGMAFYKYDKTYISGEAQINKNQINYYVDSVIIVPQEAYYARFTFFPEDTETTGERYIYGISFMKNIFEKLNFFSIYNNLWAIGNISIGTVLDASTGNEKNNADYDTTDFIPVDKINTIYGRGSRYFFFGADKTQIISAGVLSNKAELIDGSGVHVLPVPDGAFYFRISYNISNGRNYLLYARNPYEEYLYNLTIKKSGIKLYTLGDSITRGMYAEIGATASTGPTEQNYPYWIAQLNGYDLVNLGNSGSGWANIGSAETADDPSTARNAKDVVDDNNFEDADIITMAWGVNDWKGSAQDVQLGSMGSVSGDGTVIGNMKYCIETLTTKKPTAQLIVLLPLNTNRQWSGMETMTLENNWAFGYAYRYGKTLEDYRDAIRECAEYYNVKVIDLEEVCPINRLNIRNVCGDGLHPTKAFHKQMGQALAPLIH